MSRIKVIHFHNGSGGGVLSVIRNLIRFSDSSRWENHVIFTINRKSHIGFQLPKLSGAVSERIFEYNPNWNFYYTVRKLSRLVDDDKALLVAHDWLELGMVNTTGMPNPVIMFVHGDYDYYYELAQRHADAIDRFITVASPIADRLKTHLADRLDDIRYLRFPVPAVAPRTDWINRGHAIFIGRATKEKGFFLLPEIARLLNERGVSLSWHLAGISEEENHALSWPENVDVKVYGQLPNEELTRMLSKMDFYVLPSEAEGMPVSLIEAMKAGVIPIVHDLHGGIRELIIEGETGSRIAENDVVGFAEKLCMLCGNDALFARIGKNCIQHSNGLFDPGRNTRLIEGVYGELVAASRIQRKPQRSYGSRLDHSWIPNSITCLLRSVFFKRKKKEVQLPV